MADLAIRAKWQAGDADKGIQDLSRQITGLKDRAKALSDESKRAAREAAAVAKQAAAETQKQADLLKSVFRGVFGAMTVDRAVQASWTALKNTVMGLADETRTYARIQGELMRSGGNQTIGGLGTLFQQLDRASKFDETEIASAFENLVSLTGNADRSAQLLNLTMDVAIDRRMDLVTASGLVAKAAEGETAALGRMFPNLRNLNRQLEDIQGSSAAADIFLQALAKNVSGKTATDIQTAAGAWDELRQAIGELGESSVRAGAGNADTRAFLSAVATEVHKIQDGIDRNPKLLALILSGVGFPGLVGASSWVGALVARNTDPLGAGAGGVGNLRFMDEQMQDSIPGSRGNPFLMGIQNIRGRRGADKYVDPLADMRHWAGMLQPGGFGGMSGYTRESSLPFSDRMKEGPGFEQFTKRWKEDLKNQQELGNAISKTVSGALRAGAIDGWKGFADYLKSEGIDLFTSLVGGALQLGLTGTSPGGFVGAILGGLSSSSRGTMSNAASRAQAGQSARLSMARP